MSGANRDCFQSSPCCFRLVGTALVPARASCQVRNELYERQEQEARAKVMELTRSFGGGLVRRWEMSGLLLWWHREGLWPLDSLPKARLEPEG